MAKRSKYCKYELCVLYVLYDCWPALKQVKSLRIGVQSCGGKTLGIRVKFRLLHSAILVVKGLMSVCAVCVCVCAVCAA